MPARAGAAAVSAIALLSLLCLSQLKPPDVVPRSAPPAEFSAERAMEHLKVLSARPRPVGSRGHEEAGAFLLSELVKLGLRPEVQQAVAVAPGWQTTLHASTVKNVVARLEGTDSTRAILLAAHYDSAPNSFGASDNGAAVSALIETLRALRAGARLRNDVIFLFTDAEEAGLLGARAFVEEHLWAKEVGLALNFEARGNGGPSVMFETGGGNRWLVGEFARAAPRPFASSLYYDVYKLLPNDTDFTVFRGAGISGFNFAYIEGSAYYHTALDRAENIDARSLQHHGSYALALTRHFGGLDLTRTGSGDAVYFDLLGRTLVSYPRRGAVALALFAALAASAVAAYGFRKQLLTPAGSAVGALAFPLSVVAAAALTGVTLWLISFAQNVAGRPAAAGRYQQSLYAAGCVALAVAAFCLFYAWLSRRAGGRDLSAGALLWHLVLLCASVVFLPGGSYLLTWPLLFGLAALMLMLARGEAEGPTAGGAFALVLCAVPGVVLLVPVGYEVFAALGGGAGTMAAVLTTLLLLGLLVPHLSLVKSARVALLPAAAGAALIVAAVWQTDFDKARPKHNNLFYVLNADARKAVWVSPDDQPDEWTSRLLTDQARRGSIAEYAPWSYDGFWSHPSAPATLPGPELRVLDDRFEQGLRTTRVLVSSPRGAASLFVSVEAEVRGAAVGGKRITAGGRRDPADGRWTLNYWAPPAEGVEVLLETAAPWRLVIRVADKSYGLPDLPVLPQRPDHLTPAPFSDSDSTFVTRTFEL